MKLIVQNKRNPFVSEFLNWKWKEKYKKYYYQKVFREVEWYVFLNFIFIWSPSPRHLNRIPAVSVFMDLTTIIITGLKSGKIW